MDWTCTIDQIFFEGQVNFDIATHANECLWRRYNNTIERGNANLKRGCFAIVIINGIFLFQLSE